MKMMNVQLSFEGKEGAQGYSTPLHSIHLENTLERLLQRNGAFIGSAPQDFKQQIPLIDWDMGYKKLKLLFVSHHKSYLSRFIYDLMSRWLLPGRQIKVPLFFSTEFTLNGEGAHLYSFIEVGVEFDAADVELIKRIVPMLETEIRLGATSFFHASRLLEAKGLSLDEKAMLVQDKMAYLIERYPDHFDFDLLNEMQEFFIVSKDAFKAQRSVEQLFRIVTTFYSFERELQKKKEEEPSQRHLLFKVKQTRLQTPLGSKVVLGLFVGNNFLHPNECFEEKHLLKALKNIDSDLSVVPESSYISRCRESEWQLLYVEVEKGNYTPLTLDEIKLLDNGLKTGLKSHIEHLVSPVFMPRNEEEVMRNILTLSKQLKFVRDLPQVITSFDKQQGDMLDFTLVCLRVLLPESKTPAELFSQEIGTVRFSIEREKQVGFLRNRYPKEALVLKASLLSHAFLREDHSLDLYRARQQVLKEFQDLIGEIRDFNGGMMSKQTEVLSHLKALLGVQGKQYEHLLETFFFALYPVEARSVLHPQVLANFFALFNTLFLGEEGIKNRFRYQRDESSIAVIFALKNLDIKGNIVTAIEDMGLTSPQLITLELFHQETEFIGYLFFSDDAQERDHFLYRMEYSLSIVR